MSVNKTQTDRVRLRRRQLKIVSTVAAAAMVIGSGVVATAQTDEPEPTLEDATWGDGKSPCEAAFGFDKELRVDIPLNQRERELLHLAMEGFVSDLRHEQDGTAGALPMFALRTGFLDFFATVVVPTMQARIAGRFVDEMPSPENEAAMEASVQNVEFGACERISASIAIEKWSDKGLGQMARHLRLCDHSQEINSTLACDSFRPLAKAYRSLKKKLETDQ